MGGGDGIFIVITPMPIMRIYSSWCLATAVRNATEEARDERGILRHGMGLPGLVRTVQQCVKNDGGSIALCLIKSSGGALITLILIPGAIFPN
jgi:hypothetical protein